MTLPVLVLHECGFSLFFGKRVFEVYPNDNQIFCDEKPFHAGKNVSLYSGKNVRLENRGREKQLVGRPYYWGDKVLIVNKGQDGRLFWLVFSRAAFKVLRGKPFWRASYWKNKDEASFYLQDLSNPVKVWKPETKKPVTIFDWPKKKVKAIQ